MNSSTCRPRRDVFRRIAPRLRVEWPVYDATPLYERNSLDGLESDIRTVSQTWFRHDHHESVENFICALPLAYFEFDAHDRHAGSTRYEMDALSRVVILKECYGWEHETTLNEYLGCRPALCEQLGLESARTSRRCGVVGTTGSLPSVAVPSRQLRGPSASKPRTRMSQSHASQSGALRLTVTRRTNQT